MAGSRKTSRGRYTRRSVWDDAADLKVYRGGEKLDPGANYFVLMLDQLGLPTHYSCEGHPGGFYIMFDAPYEKVLELKAAGYFTVEVEGENRWSIRMHIDHSPAQHVDALRWAADAWQGRFGLLDFDSVQLVQG